MLMTFWDLIRPDGPEAHLARWAGPLFPPGPPGQSAEDRRGRSLALVLVNVDLERERPRSELGELELGFDGRDEIDTLVHKLVRLETLKDRRDLARERADRVHDRDDVEKAVGRVAVGEGTAPVAIEGVVRET